MSTKRSQGTTVIIAGSDYFTRQALRETLEEPGIDVISTCSGQDECIVQVGKQRPQVVVADIMEHENRWAGIEFCHRVRSVSPTTICIVLTANDGMTDIFAQAFAAGMHAYIPKATLRGKALVTMIKRYATGRWHIDPQTAEVMLRHITSYLSSSSSKTRARRSILSNQEFELLQLVKLGRDHSEVAEALAISESSVEIRMYRIIQKFVNPDGRG